MKNNNLTILKHKREILKLQKNQTDEKISVLSGQSTAIAKKIERINKIIQSELQELAVERTEKKQSSPSYSDSGVRIPRIGE